MLFGARGLAQGIGADVQAAAVHSGAWRGLRGSGYAAARLQEKGQQGQDENAKQIDAQ